MKRILPTGDLAFKKVFSSEEHKECLRGLIADFLMVEVPPEDIIIENPYSIEAFKEVRDGEEIMQLRETIKDVSASLKFADFISELQIKQTRFFAERIIYYPFDRFCQNYNRYGLMESDREGRPNRYSSLRPVYALNILGESYFTDDEDALRVFELYDPKRGKSFSRDLIKVGFFELAKKNIETGNQKHWRDYFLTGEVGAEAPEYIKKASKVIELVNLSEEEKRMATLLERAEARRDAESSDYYNNGIEAGMIQGIAQGIAKRDLEIASTMLNDGLALEMVSKYTGLSPEYLRTLSE